MTDANREVAGRCGESPPSITGEPPLVCALPAGHAGWHRADSGTEWSITDPDGYENHHPDQGWFADIDSQASHSAKWQPCLQLDGYCPSLPIWYETEEACLAFIRRDLIGQGMLDD